MATAEMSFKNSVKIVSLSVVFCLVQLHLDQSFK